jgi:hypothetical protein
LRSYKGCRRSMMMLWKGGRRAANEAATHGAAGESAPRTGHRAPYASCRSPAGVDESRGRPPQRRSHENERRCDVHSGSGPRRCAARRG